MGEKSQKLIRVMHIPTGGLFSDGILSCITAYMSNMDLSDMQVTVLATNQADAEVICQVHACGCEVVQIPYRKTEPAKYFRKLCRYIKDEKIDIVHVHGSSALMSVELLAAKCAGCKVRIAHSHNTTCENQRADKLLRPLFNRLYTTAFACGKEAGKWLFAGRDFTVIPNARDLKKYAFREERRTECRKAMGIPEDAFVIGHVGRFNYQKNQEYLVRIFEKIAEKNEKAFLALVGTGETAADVKQQVCRLGLESRVRFTGVLSNVHEYLSSFDVMLLPSRYEGLPLVVVEWQIAGLPCIVADTVTEECKVTDLVSFLPICEDPSVWAAKVESIRIGDRKSALRENLGRFQQAGYDISQSAAMLKERYLELSK